MRALLHQFTIIAGCLLMLSTPALSSTPAASAGLQIKQVNGWQIPYKPIDMVQSPDESTIFILTENHQVLIYERNGTLKGSFPVDPGITAIDTNLRGERLLLIDSEKNVFRTLAIDFLAEIDITGSPFKGPADAPVTIVVFSDFE